MWNCASSASATLPGIPLTSLYPWQTALLAEVSSVPHPRKVIWVWDSDGGIGKTFFAKVCYQEFGSRMLYVNGKASDIKYAIAMLKEKTGVVPSLIIFGIPRTAEQYVSYAALEEIKDGIMFSGKYEAGMLVFPTPHVLVFANFAPDESKLSMDRWDVRNMTVSSFLAYSEPLVGFGAT